MSTGKKISLWLLISPFILFFIFSIIWDPNWFRGQAEPHLEDIEGHRIDFVSLEHSLLDPGYVEVQDISIKGEFINGSLGTLILDGSIKEALNQNIVIREITLKDTDLDIDIQALKIWLEQQAEEEDIHVESDAKVDGFPVNNIYIQQVALKNIRVEDVSELQQFVIAGLHLTLRELNIAENAEIVIGNLNNPVNAELEIDKVNVASSPSTKVNAEVVATSGLITLKELNVTTEKSMLAVNGIVRNPKTDAEVQVVLQDSHIVLDEFAQMLDSLPLEAKGSLKINGELYAKGQLNKPETLMNTLASNVNVMLDTGRSQLDIAGELRSEAIDEVATNVDAGTQSQDTTQSHQANIKLRINDSHINLAELEPLLKDLPVKPSGDAKLSGIISTAVPINGGPIKDELMEGDQSQDEQLQNSNSFMAGLNGNINLDMMDGSLQGIDVNKIVSSFKDSKETDLVDVGSFLLTGPIGILASNLMDLGGAARFEGDTVLPHLHVKGKIEDGEVNLHNTALATDEYRLAFDGAINPGKGTFEEFTFAILDKQGCADIKQTLNGEFTQPTSAVAKSLLDSALAPVTGLVSSIKNTAVKCTPFYDGEVPHPTR